MSSGTIPRPQVLAVDIDQAGSEGSIPDLLPYIQGLPDGLKILLNSNKPANRPTDCNYGGYIIAKMFGNARAMYFNSDKIAVSGIISSSSTSITWGVYHTS